MKDCTLKKIIFFENVVSSEYDFFNISFYVEVVHWLGFQYPSLLISCLDLHVDASSYQIIAKYIRSGVYL